MAPAIGGNDELRFVSGRSCCEPYVRAHAGHNQDQPCLKADASDTGWARRKWGRMQHLRDVPMRHDAVFFALGQSPPAWARQCCTMACNRCSPQDVQKHQTGGNPLTPVQQCLNTCAVTRACRRGRSRTVANIVHTSTGEPCGPPQLEASAHPGPDGCKHLQVCQGRPSNDTCILPGRSSERLRPDGAAACRKQRIYTTCFAMKQNRISSSSTQTAAIWRHDRCASSTTQRLQGHKRNARCHQVLKESTGLRVDIPHNMEAVRNLAIPDWLHTKENIPSRASDRTQSDKAAPHTPGASP